MDIFYDFLFLIDIILNFGIPITNREGKFIFIKIYIGEDVYNRKIVVKNYIKKYVAMDIISSIPITYLQIDLNNKLNFIYQIYGFLLMFKFLRLRKVIILIY
jgi:hypothetical protein